MSIKMQPCPRLTHPGRARAVQARPLSLLCLTTQAGHRVRSKWTKTRKTLRKAAESCLSVAWLGSANCSLPRRSTSRLCSPRWAHSARSLLRRLAICQGSNRSTSTRAVREIVRFVCDPLQTSILSEGQAACPKAQEDASFRTHQRVCRRQGHRRTPPSPVKRDKATGTVSVL